MPNRVGDRYGTALGDTKQRETVQTAGIGNDRQIGDHSVKREVVHAPVGETVAALIVPDERVLF